MCVRCATAIRGAMNVMVIHDCSTPTHRHAHLHVSYRICADAFGKTEQICITHPNILDRVPKAWRTSVKSESA